MKQVLEGINFANFLTKFLEGIKISQNSYFENSILKFPRLCACKSLIYLNLYKRTFLIKVNGCWLEDLYLRKFLLTKYFKFYEFEDFTNRIKLYKSTIEFLKNKVVQRSPFRC